MCRSDEGILFYSIRSGAGPASPLQGSRLEDDGIPIQPLNDHLLGQIDSIEAGEMTGWACMKGYMGKPLQVWKVSCLKGMVRFRQVFLCSIYVFSLILLCIVTCPGPVPTSDAFMMASWWDPGLSCAQLGL